MKDEDYRVVLVCRFPKCGCLCPLRVTPPLNRQSNHTHLLFSLYFVFFFSFSGQGQRLVNSRHTDSIASRKKTKTREKAHNTFPMPAVTALLLNPAKPNNVYAVLGPRYLLHSETLDTRVGDAVGRGTGDELPHRDRARDLKVNFKKKVEQQSYK